MQNNMSTLELPESIYKQAKIKVHCSTCGAEMIVTYKAYDRKCKHGDNKWTCRKCLGAEASARYKLKSPEEKAEQVKAMLAARRVQLDTMTDEQRAEIGAKLSKSIRRYNENRTEEQKQAASERCRKAQYKRWANSTEEERQRNVANMLTAQAEWRESLSPEDRKRYHDILQAGNSRWWENAPAYERTRLSRIRSEASNAYWSSRTEEERRAYSERQKIWFKTFWDNMTKEDYAEWSRKWRDGVEAATRKDPEAHTTPSEGEFKKILDNIGIKYTHRWFSKQKHPDFDKIFVVNPFTGESRISPYHQWDFKIELPNAEIVVDIDGSIHNPNMIWDMVTLPTNGKKVGMVSLMAYHDSKREYQTDGLPAYVVRCWDDKLTPETPVYSIDKNEVSNMNEFINALAKANKVSSK